MGEKEKYDKVCTSRFSSLILQYNQYLNAMTKRLSMTLLLLVLLIGGAAAQKLRMYGVAFYNMENLFDTQHDEGKNDYDFLPDGSYQWTEQKYAAKLHNMAQVVSELCTEVGTARNPVGAAIIGMSEVENRRVLEDLLRQPTLAQRGYEIVHIEGPDRRGIDVAMLYNPKAFRLERAMLVPNVTASAEAPNDDLGFYTDAEGRVQAHSAKNGELKGDTTHISRGFLVASGWLGGERMHIIVNHWPSRGATSPARERAGRQVRLLKEALFKQDPESKIIVMGDLNDDPDNVSIAGAEALGAKHDKAACSATDFYNPWWDTLLKRGIGTLCYNNKWNLFDQILLTGNMLTGDRSTLQYYGHAVFTRDYLLQTEGRYKGYPKRTTAGGTWLNGYSDHLPTQVFLIKQVQ